MGGVAAACGEVVEGVGVGLLVPGGGSDDGELGVLRHDGREVAELAVNLRAEGGLGEAGADGGGDDLGGHRLGELFDGAVWEMNLDHYGFS